MATQLEGRILTSFRHGYRRESYLLWMGGRPVRIQLNRELANMVQTLTALERRTEDLDRTLVVDPDREYVEIIRTTLRRESGHIESADSVSSAVNLLRRQVHDVVILDHGLPGRSALDLTRALRQSCPEVALIVTSESRLTVAEVVACFEAGADEYIEKPFHPLEFAARVSAVTRRAKRGIRERPSEAMPA